VVGILLPTTGSASSYGESIESGIRVALAEAREGKGLPQGFETVWMDTGSDPARAVSELQEMVHKKDVKMVIGGATSDEARAMIPELKKLNVVCLSPSARAEAGQISSATSPFLRQLQECS
jgi:ABC-type branched-subunit amino acid transport system substrate-binding protein